MGDLFDIIEPYPNGVPAVAGSDTSEAAADSLAESVTALRRDVLRAVSAADDGMTCDEIEVRLGLRHQTASARVRELSLLGLIEDTGVRRKTRSGRGARVYVVAGSYREAAE